MGTGLSISLKRENPAHKGKEKKTQNYTNCTEVQR